jgi:activator of HSP90 ATPase
MPQYKKYYIVPVEPEILYAALTNEYTIQLWTGDLAEMSTEVGSEFSLWDGSIVGKNLAFEPNKLIQQEWYFGDQIDKSIVTIKLHTHPKGTSVELLHTNIPEQDFEDMCAGWDDSYFGALQDFYSEG